MGKYFSDIVEKAVEDLYYCYDNERAKNAADALLGAARGGDGDACYFLYRCFSGPGYSWAYHSFKESKAAASAMLRQAVSLGSAVAVLDAIRIGLLTAELRKAMPFSSIGEAWQIVCQKAENGCLFCQYMIGNAYYFLDTIEIEDVKEGDFPSKDAWDSWRREQVRHSIHWFEKAFSSGMGMAGRNYFHYYQKGREDLIPPEPERALEVARQGADLGYPDWMHTLANELCYHLNQPEEALPWALRAAEAGHLYSWHIVGDIYYIYWTGKAVERNLPYALECFEKAASYGNDTYACRQAGEMYFRGLGTPQDYARAVQYLEQVDDDECNDMLGICYLLGYGCQQDAARGRALLETSHDTILKNYGLGMMYAEGIGVWEDIEKGVEYLKAAGNYIPAKEALKNYKKNLFGVWRRKKKKRI